MNVQLLVTYILYVVILVISMIGVYFKIVPPELFSLILGSVLMHFGLITDVPGSNKTNKPIDPLSLP